VFFHHSGHTHRSKRTFLLDDTDLARAWGQRSRHEYYTLYPHYMLGTVADRNHSVTRDLSGLRPL
jgi:3',5'-cyclic-AMP phosphodiesterase